ncbi:MAG: GNAT family N-acetyltransferase [Syntrophomonas sp.]
MHELTLINPVEQENWNNLLLNTAGCSFFHTADWADVLSRSYNYQPLYFCKTKDDKLDCLLPIMEVASPLTGKRGACLPFTDFCEPLAANQNQFQELISWAIELGRKRKWKYLEIRGGEKYLAEEKPSQVFWGHELDLSIGQQQLLSGLRASTRRNINKAQNEKVEVQISGTLNALKAFCRLNVLTRREHGLPPQPYQFFQNLYDRVIAQNKGFLATASVSGQIIAANVYLHFDKEVVYKYGASDRQYQHLRANNLVMWEAIKWSADKGFKQMTFGRTEPEHKGLMQFKAGWGAKPYPIYYYKYDFKGNAFVSESGSIHPSMKKIFSKLPHSALQTLGRILYRHMG